MPAATTKKKKGKAKVDDLTPEKLEALINQRWGEGTMRRASDPSLQITRLESGLLSVDAMIGGGFARGRHAEIYGSASVGKNYLAYKLMATTQQAGGRCFYFNVEKSFDPKFAGHVGVNLDELGYHEQIHGPRVIDVAETTLRSKLYDVIVIDSIATLLPLPEYENDMEAGSYGMEQAKLMSKALRKLTAANDQTVLIFLNQTREKIGGMAFGKKTTTSGGRAMAFYAGLRLELVRTETMQRTGKLVNQKTGEITIGKVPYGHRVLVRGEKDKTGGLSRPLEETTFVFDYEKGSHDHIEDLIYLGRDRGLIEVKGKGNAQKWWVEDYEDEVASGRTRFKKWLRKNKAVCEELEEKIKDSIDSSETSEDEEDDEE